MNIAVIFAGGTGQRMGSGIPKQFLEVYGKPIIIHTLEKFQYHSDIDKIYVACKEELIPEFKEMIKKYHISKISENAIVSGGKTGQDSIFNALCAVYKNENRENHTVLIHDGVRPVITEEVITKNIESVKEFGSAITCTPCYETPLISEDGKHVTSLPKRRIVYTAQAPQSFKLYEVLAAHIQTRKINPNYTDVVDTCTLMHNMGKKVHLIEGNKDNMKVTTPKDYFDLQGRLAAVDQKNFFELSLKQ